MDQTFPDNLKNDTSDLGLLRIEQRRLFPLCYEPDNQETTIPQRVLGWYLPTIDNDIIDVYLKIPPKYKLNTSLYSKMVERQCGEKIARIRNINTGARVNASPISLIFHGFWRKLQRLLRERRKSIATDESWPNWQYYVPHSNKIGPLWLKKSQIADDVFRQIMGKDGYEISIEKYAGEPQNKLFLRLLTLKLWLDQHV
jgi:asparagine synthase (glutamine-hydrolysing)